MAEVIIVGMSFRCAAEEFEEAVGVVAEAAETADDFRLASGQDGFKLAGVVHAELVAAACRKQEDALARWQGGGDIQNAFVKTEIRASDRFRTFPAPVAVRCYFRCVL